MSRNGHPLLLLWSQTSLPLLYCIPKVGQSLWTTDWFPLALQCFSLSCLSLSGWFPLALQCFSLSLSVSLGLVPSCSPVFLSFPVSLSRLVPSCFPVFLSFPVCPSRAPSGSPVFSLFLSVSLGPSGSPVFSLFLSVSLGLVSSGSPLFLSFPVSLGLVPSGGVLSYPVCLCLSLCFLLLLLLIASILRSRVDSLRSYVILHEWIAFYSAFLNIYEVVTYSTDMAISVCLSVSPLPFLPPSFRKRPCETE